MSEVYELEQQLKDAKQFVEHSELALQLSKNKAFKKLILEEYCIYECARYAQLSADPALSKEHQQDALAMAQAAGHLKRFLSVVMQMGHKAENDIKFIEEELEAARAEEI